MLSTDCFDGISIFSVAWTPSELFSKGLHPRTKTEIEQNVFPYKQSFHLITTIMYSTYYLHKLYRQEALLLHIILLHVKTPQTREKRF